MKRTDTVPGEKWYGKFVKNNTAGKKQTIARKYTEKKQLHGSQPGYPSQERFRAADAKLITVTHLFNASAVPDDARKVLDNFSAIVQGVFPSNSRQLRSLPLDIRQLSHELTDERAVRRLGYMNNPAYISAYVRYFTWWNLVRLTRLFANLGSRSFPLKDGDYCLDIGSGPLTVVTALWLACPELRNRKLTWYCMDISQNVLSTGEDIYLSAAARTPPADSNAEPHWNIIRIKGPMGTNIREKASFITCANMFNELYQDGQFTPEELAQKYAAALRSYADTKHTVFVVEPGVPRQARIISLLRDSFIKSGMAITAPCPHVQACAMNGLHARTGGTAKWCNFAFSTEDAPQELLKLSADAGIPKERAVLSFVLATTATPEVVQSRQTCESPLTLRITSDPIRLPGHRTGYYACSTLGLTLAVDVSECRYKSGDNVTVKTSGDLRTLRKDAKTGAKELSIEE
ncbi:MAG: small ribosomal subunit Rsm22 family protein [Treponema sp.]|nr:small ribosomal subunit Rsm22 family protein [Treponema sp.]